MTAMGSRQPSLEEMRQHAACLLEEHEIQYHPRSRGACAMLEAWEVQFPPVKSDLSYATALHEIGHLLGRFQTSASTMVRERWAWLNAMPSYGRRG